MGPVGGRGFGRSVKFADGKNGKTSGKRHRTFLKNADCCESSLLFLLSMIENVCHIFTNINVHVDFARIFLFFPMLNKQN